MSLFPLLGVGQSVFDFTDGLCLKDAFKYGREAIYKDPLAWQLYSGTLNMPEPGGAVTGVNTVWVKVKADSSGRLGGRGYWGNGYLYLTYQSTEERTAVLHIEGNNAVYVNGALHFGDPYRSGWMYIPIRLKKGLNEFYVRGEYSKARLLFTNTPLSLNTEDSTVPDIVQGEDNKNLKVGVVIINSSEKDKKNLKIKAVMAGKTVISSLPVVPAMSTRKVPFVVDASSVTTLGKNEYSLVLIDAGNVVDKRNCVLESVKSTDKYRATFLSEIDGSLQYYAVAPQTGGSVKGASLFLSVHGAGVEAINQVKAYESKEWGTIVSPTNRRPRGFNWEDWGRLDALEVLHIATKKLHPDPRKIYLTGHSMGGHGTWFLGATYSEKWAAIAPCAGYPTLKGYGSADGLVPDKGASAIEQVLLRSSNQSDVPALATNYKPMGVYILHGDADPVVSVDYARQMKKILANFHPDNSYYEYPGGNHWYSNESVDWKPLFDYFKWHQRPVDTAVNYIDFKTASPGISASYYWASVMQQQHPLEYSQIVLRRDRAAGTIRGMLSNVKVLRLALNDFSIGQRLRITLDSLNTVVYDVNTSSDTLHLLKTGNTWSVRKPLPVTEKGPLRYGTFKDPFNHRMVFVYGTSGNRTENEWNLKKAKYDAEAWYYRGNGAIDIVSDKEYSATKYAGRNVIIYGNANSNSLYKEMLKGCPVSVSRNEVKVGDRIWKGEDLAAYFIWPMSGSAINSVAVVAGTGGKGMSAAEANQYFAGASGFPDLMVFSLDMLKGEGSGVKCAGFYNMDWKLGSEVVYEK